MRRGLVNLRLDLTAAALLTAVVATGYLLAFALPPGTNRTHWLWGLLRHEWGTLHAGTHSARAMAGGIRADTPAALTAKQGDVKWIVPGDPDASPLFQVVGVHEATRPVAPKHRLTEVEWQALRRWIASLPPRVDGRDYR